MSPFILFVVLMNGNMTTARFDDYQGCMAASRVLPYVNLVASPTGSRKGDVVDFAFCLQADQMTGNWQ